MDDSDKELSQKYDSLFMSDQYRAFLALAKDLRCEQIEIFNISDEITFVEAVFEDGQIRLTGL